MATEVNSTRIIGVVADTRRDYENDYACEKCCVFGLSEDEYHVIAGSFTILPEAFDSDVDRYVVRANPWRTMRILGENFGYHLTVTPLGGRIEGPTGERRTCIWTLVSSNILTKPNPN